MPISLKADGSWRSRLFDSGRGLRPRSRKSSVPGEGVYGYSINPHENPPTSYEVEAIQQRNHNLVHFLKKAYAGIIRKAGIFRKKLHYKSADTHAIPLAGGSDEAELQGTYLERVLLGDIRIPVPNWEWDHKTSTKWLYKLLRELPEDIGKRSAKEAKKAIKDIERHCHITGNSIYILNRAAWMRVLGCTVGAFIHEQMLLIKSNAIRDANPSGLIIHELCEQEVQQLSRLGLAQHRTACSCFGGLEHGPMGRSVYDNAYAVSWIDRLLRSISHHTFSNESPDQQIPEVTRKRTRSILSI
ncbi:hypothetical protein PVAG01_01411 [Phlyctema vagabunda]|uniref:Uncharacterized protein n=1 Tax=Phlyctema vagabunda TaxID=108571 RepID=A0ABR4PX14_9HELO